MAKAKSASVSHFLHKFGWPALAIISVIGNIVLVGGYQYLLRYDPSVITSDVVQANCSTEGYLRMMKKISDSSNDSASVNLHKKFAAAALCFTDWETGKSIDLNSIKPSNGNAQFPAKP